MKCPKCGKVSTAWKTRIREQCERDTALDQQRRSRECLFCGHRWDTMEVTLEELCRLRRLAFRAIMGDV